MAGITWPLPPDLDDEALAKALFVSPEEQRAGRPLPDWPRVHTELKRKHVTLALLWQEYKSEHQDGYQYSQFCDRYRAWVKRGAISTKRLESKRGTNRVAVIVGTEPCAPIYDGRSSFSKT